MNYDYLTNAELVQAIESSGSMTALERLLVDRLVSAMQEIKTTLKELPDARQQVFDFTHEVP